MVTNIADITSATVILTSCKTATIADLLLKIPITTLSATNTSAL